MKLSRRKTDQGMELIVDGRLDAYSADHLNQEVTKIMHGGTHNLSLQLREVHYISSAGIRVLLQFRKQLKQIGGSLSLREVSTTVRSVLQLTGFEELLIASEPVERIPESVNTSEGLFVERTVLDSEAQFSCRLLGIPDPFPVEGFKPHQSHSVTAGKDSFGLGLGALGADYDECGSRFGEWLMVSGAAAYLPTDRMVMPDYNVSTGTYYPTSQVLYGMICEGTPAWRTKFEARGQREVVSLSEILAQTLTELQIDSAGIILVAETASLVGVALRKASTAPLQGRMPLAHSEIREWLTYTPERAFPQSVTLVVGVVSRQPSLALADWLRPLGSECGLYAHLHAAVFSPHPLRRGEVSLSETVRGLFGEQRLQGMLHLLRDDRSIQGAGDSEFTRGLCWSAPLGRIYNEALT